MKKHHWHADNEFARRGAWCRSLLVFESEGAAVTAAKRTDHLTIYTADSALRMNNALASTEDVLDVFPDEAISACAAISSHRDPTRNSGELIKILFIVFFACLPACLPPFLLLRA